MVLLVSVQELNLLNESHLAPQLLVMMFARPRHATAAPFAFRPIVSRHRIGVADIVSAATEQRAIARASSLR